MSLVRGRQNIAISVSVCLLAHISEKPHVQTVQNFLYVLAVASSYENVIHYLLLIVSFFHTVEHDG